MAVAALIVMALGAVDSAAAQPPYINAGFADRPVEPTRFSPELRETPPKALMKSPANNYVRSIHWSSWGGKEAVGSGQVSLLHGEPGIASESYGPGETSPVTVRLAGLSQCAGVQVYTSYSLELAAGAEAPEGWPRGQTGSFPCNIESAGQTWPSHYHEHECSPYGYKGLEPPLLPPLDGAPKFFPAPRFQPALPFHLRRLNPCLLRPKHWGSARPTLAGFGVAYTNPEGGHIWPVKLEPQGPIWCPAAARENGSPWAAAAITYGSLKLTLYGKGSPWELGEPTGSSNHHGLKPRVYWEHIHPSPGQCLLGIEDTDPTYNPSGATP